MELCEINHHSRQKRLTGGLRRLTEASRQAERNGRIAFQTFILAAKPKTSLTVVSTRRTALVMAAQTMSAPASA